MFAAKDLNFCRFATTQVSQFYTGHVRIMMKTRLSLAVALLYKKFVINITRHIYVSRFFGSPINSRRFGRNIRRCIFPPTQTSVKST